MIDIFNGNAFGVVAMTQAINRAPFAPQRIGASGLFEVEGVTSTSVPIEINEGVLSLIPSSPRGGEAVLAGRSKRTMKVISTTHKRIEDAIIADDVQGVRAFGSATEVETVAGRVATKLASHRQQHEVTQEHLRLGAIKGVLTDADNLSVIEDLYQFFGLTRSSVDFELEAAGTEVLTRCLNVARMIEDELGAAVYTGITCYCGKDFFDAITTHPMVKETYKRFLDGQVNRTDNREGFEFGPIVFIEYRGKVDGVPFVAPTEANFFPTGVPGLFKSFYAPADYEETVNTVGQPFYARQEPKKMNRGRDLESQSNPLMLCSRPGVLIQGNL